MYSGNRPLVGVYWSDRSESVSAAAERLHALFGRLAAAKLGFTAPRLRDAGGPLDSPAAIAAALAARAETDASFNPYGFTVDGEDETGRLFEATVGAHLGLEQARTPNSVVVAADGLSVSEARTLLGELVAATTPEWGVSTTWGHMMSLAMAGSPGGPHVGRWTWFAARRGRLPALPDGVRAESIHDGTLLQIVDEPFEPLRDRLHDLLERRGLLRPVIAATPPSSGAPSSAATDPSGDVGDLRKAVVCSFLHHALRAASVGPVLAGAPHGAADLAVYLEEGAIGARVPHLVVDVLPASRAARTYRGARMSAHEGAGVPWLWLVDPALATVEVYELGADGRYARALTAEGTTELPGLLSVTLDLDALFAEVDRLCP